MVLLAQRVVMAVVGAAVADTASVGVGRSIVLFYSFFFRSQDLQEHVHVRPDGILPSEASLGPEGEAPPQARSPQPYCRLIDS